MSNDLYSSFLRLPLIIRTLIIALLIIFSFGTIVYLIEPSTFPTLFEGIWWAIITASTVGYGDFVPQTVLGKIIGITLILVGAGFVSTYFITLATSAVTKQNEYLEGKLMFKGKNHFIVVGWNERSREVISSLLHSDRTHTIVLIDQTLESNPFSDHHVHFIKGRSNQDEVLIKANIPHAEKVLITADQNKDELHADMHSILTLLAIKGINSQVYCIVEILTAEQVANAKRAGADEILQSNIMSSYIMVNSFKTEGIVNSFIHLLDEINGSRLKFTATGEYAGRTFQEICTDLLNEHKLLIGIKRGENTIVNPPQHTVIEDSDELFIISD
ncbi:potassium channel family protein [Cytobacillus sp. FJAT-54145]|uniref:Potassium channel family protein n=1 Tax=Cytobacillus spartinae TaxID=3299023 RepID=A0ABW6KDS5_9BACI